jgi:hypothetical protein
MQTSDVRTTAQNAVNQSKSFLTKQVDERSTLLGERIGALAGDLRSVGERLRRNGAGGVVAGYADRGAALIDGLGTYLQDADSERLLGDLENAARRQPWAFAAGALALGFASSRLLKTSSERRYDSAAAVRDEPNVTRSVETVRGTFGGVVGSVKETVANATGKAGDLSGKLRSPGEIRRMARRGAGIAIQNPLGMVLGVLAAGFLVGLATPVSGYERKTVGPLREGLLNKAQTIGSDALEHGKAVLHETAQSALETAQRSAQHHGAQVFDEAMGQRAHGGNNGAT